MGTGAWCGMAPLLFRKKLSGFEGKEQATKSSKASKNQKQMKGSTVRNSCGVAGNFIKMTDIRNKILTFRDLLDLSPCIGSASVNELLIWTLKDIQRLYPSTRSGISISDVEGAPMHKILRCFCDVLKILGDSWTNNAEWMVKCKYDASNKLGQDGLEQLAQGMLEDMNKVARERMFDMMTDEDIDQRMSDFSPSENAFGRSYSDGKTSLSSSPATPTSVLPNMRNAGGTKALSYSPPLLLQLRVQAVEKLNPIDVKRLSFHMLSHAVAQEDANNYGQVQKSDQTAAGKQSSEAGTNDFEMEEDTMDIVMDLDGSGRNGGGGTWTRDVNSKSGPARKKVDMDHVVPPPTSLPKLRSNVSEKENPPPPDDDQCGHSKLYPNQLASQTPPPPPILSPNHEVVVSEPILSSSPKMPLPSPPPPPPPPVPAIAREITTVACRPPPPPPPPPPPVESISTTLFLPPPPPPPPSIISGNISPPPLPNSMASGSVKLPPPPPPPPMGSGKMVPPPPPPPAGAPNGGGRVPPPPMPPGMRGGAPPPPPGPGGARSLHARKAATKLKRSSQMGNLYRLLKGTVEGGTPDTKSSRKGKISSPAGGKQGMADALAEMTKRSAYFQQIEEDVKNHEKSIRELKTSISSFESSNMDELWNFHKHVESTLEKLTDETQVLARFEDFPTKKLEAMRMAAALYSKLDSIAKTLRSWQIESPVGQVIDKLENYFTKVKQELDALERTKDEESKKFKNHKITFDFGILVRIKEQMVDVSSSCMELALKEKRDAKAAESAEKNPKTERQKKGSAKMLWKAFQFAYRIYTFAGGHDDRADQLTREIANEIQTDPSH